MKLQTIEGIGPVYEGKLQAVGINSVEALLDACSTKKERDDLALRAGLSPKRVLTWANHADLFRIKGVAGEYSELLEAAGIDTIVELATRNPVNLTKKMEEVNEAKRLVRKVPVLSQVEDWVKQAADLPRKLFY